jgi:hypothetical protein
MQSPEVGVALQIKVTIATMIDHPSNLAPQRLSLP